MTKQEALEVLRDTPIDIRSTREDDIHTLYATAQNIAIDCILKQIPQKAIDYVCPICGHDMGFDEKHHCSNCGQRIGDNE